VAPLTPCCTRIWVKFEKDKMSDKGGKKGKQPPIESLESLESPAEVQVSAAEEKKKKKKQKNNSYPSRTAKSLCPLCRCLTDTRKLREHQARKTCQIVQNALRYHGLREQAEDDDTPNGGVVIDIYLLATVTRALLHCAERLQSLDPRLAKFYHWDLIKKTAERGMVRTQLAAEQEEEEEEEEEEEQTKKKKSKKVGCGVLSFSCDTLSILPGDG